VLANYFSYFIDYSYTGTLILEQAFCSSFFEIRLLMFEVISLYWLSSHVLLVCSLVKLMLVLITDQQTHKLTNWRQTEGLLPSGHAPW